MLIQQLIETTYDILDINCMRNNKKKCHNKIKRIIKLHLEYNVNQLKLSQPNFPLTRGQNTVK